MTSCYYKRAGKSFRYHAFTMVESLLAVVLLTLLLIAALSLATVGTRAFGNTAQSQYNELDMTRAARRIEGTLAEACDCSFSNQTLTYYNYQTGVYPPKKDTTPHTITLSGTDLTWSDAPAKPLLRNVTVFTATKSTSLVTVNLKTQETASTYAARGPSGAGAKAQQTVVRVILRNYSQTGTQ